MSMRRAKAAKGAAAGKALKRARRYREWLARAGLAAGDAPVCVMFHSIARQAKTYSARDLAAAAEWVVNNSRLEWSEAASGAIVARRLSHKQWRDRRRLRAIAANQPPNAKLT